MNEMCHDIVLTGVTDIHILKKSTDTACARDGAVDTSGRRHQFEWRVTQGFPALTRLYAGSESGT